MGRFGVGLGSLVVISAVSAVQAKEPIDIVTLKPTSRWNLEFADEKCRLAREFDGEGGNNILYLEQGGPDREFDLTVAGPEVAKLGETGKVTTAFGDFPSSERNQPFDGTNSIFGAALIYSSLDFRGGWDESDANGASTFPQINLADASQVNSLTITREKRKVIFETGEMRKAIEALNFCSQDLIRDWGLDLEKHQRASRMPVRKNRDELARWIGKLYPAQALRAGQSGIVRLRLLIDEHGKVAKCNSNKATTASVLESPACKAARKAKFEPALDSEGKPMPSFFLTNVIYKVNE